MHTDGQNFHVKYYSVTARRSVVLCALCPGWQDVSVPSKHMDEYEICICDVWNFSFMVVVYAAVENAM